ncbi:MAG: phosphorylase [Gammaproteobacteria bacterium]|nr:phosphorylase [Gammaproteobacteria bacterium]
MKAAGVVAALRAEARTLGSPIRRSDGLLAVSDGTLVAVSGMGSSAAEAAARALVDAGAAALVSWGMAGGLDPALHAGTICLPSVVISLDGDAFATDHHWRELLAAAIAARRTVVSGKLLTGGRVIEDVAGKAAAFRKTGAAAVDLESLAVARVAAMHHLPFIAVRVIVDTAGDVLPNAVMAASGQGQVQLSKLILGVIRSPRDIAPLFRLAKRYRAASRALIAVARTGALAPLALGAPPSRIA